MGRFRKRVYEIVETARPGDRASRLFDVLIMVLIGMNLLAIVLESMESLSIRFQWVFRTIETVSILVFLAEYLLRLWSVTVDPRYGHPILGRLRFMLTPLALVDLVAILPWFMTFTKLDLRSIRAIRLFRFLRVLKIGRYSKAIDDLSKALRSRKEQILITMGLTVTLILISSSLIYFAENGVQPEKFSSIPASTWWAISTMTTVGYGDVYPMTPLGKVFGAITAILGVGFFALPTAIISSAFMEQVQKRKYWGEECCPHCGKSLPPRNNSQQ